MNAKKCDRCGVFYEGYNTRNDKNAINGVMFLNIDLNERYYSHAPNDLCPTCSEELVNWFDRTNKVNSAKIIGAINIGEENNG